MMANAYYDIKTPYTFGVNPYLGGGIGLAYLMTSEGTLPAFSNERLLKRDGDTVFAYQAAVGLAYDITPKVTLDLGYRYFGTTEGTFETDGSVNAVNGPEAKMDFSSHNFIIGARYNF
jgi:opacity protein-like surface antigen